MPRYRLRRRVRSIARYVCSPTVLRVGEALDRQGRAGLLGLAAAVVFIVIGVGTPLLGIKTFHGADTASNLAPWFEERTTVHDQSVAPLNDTFDAIAPPLID